jgi:hypothetical protein
MCKFKEHDNKANKKIKIKNFRSTDTKVIFLESIKRKRNSSHGIVSLMSSACRPEFSSDERGSRQGFH